MGRKPKPAEVRVKFFLASPSRGDAEAGRSRRGGHLPLAGHYWLAQSGGVRPRVTRPRPALRLSLEERSVAARAGRITNMVPIHERPIEVLDPWSSGTAATCSCWR